MAPFIDDIKYGNPTAEDHSLLLSENYLDRLLPQLYKLPAPPKNSSRATKEELNILLAYSGMAEQKGRKNIFDASLVPYIQELFISNGADKDYIINMSHDVVNDVIPIITKLKFYHQRPRPYQLALYHKFAFYPKFSYFTSSPSYPSGHTVIAAVLCDVLGNQFPDSYEAMIEFTKEVRESRLYLGVHYPSDNDIAMKVSEIILSNPEFMQKYRL